MNASPAVSAAAPTFTPAASPGAAGPSFDALIVRIVGRREGVYWLDEQRREVGPYPCVQAALRELAQRGM